MKKIKITHDNLPLALTLLIRKTSQIINLLNREDQLTPEPDRWFDLAELCDYLPGRPARVTIYGKVHSREIPHKKVGKRLAFLKSEIDQWLKEKGRKTASEINAEAEAFLQSSNKKG